MIFSRDKMHFDKMSRLKSKVISGRTNTENQLLSRLMNSHDKYWNPVIVSAVKKEFQARHLHHDVLFLSRLIFRRDKNYTYNPIACRGCSLTCAPSRGDLTRGVCFRRACQAPTHDDKKKCPGVKEGRT